jgi:hypothetical protein
VQAGGVLALGESDGDLEEEGDKLGLLEELGESDGDLEFEGESEGEFDDELSLTLKAIMLQTHKSQTVCVALALTPEPLSSILCHIAAYPIVPVTAVTTPVVVPPICLLEYVPVLYMPPPPTTKP